MYLGTKPVEMAHVYDTHFENGMNLNPSVEENMWEHVSEHAEHGDNDLGRTVTEQKADKVQGDIGEALVYKALSNSPGLTVEYADGKDCDLFVNDYSIEVKSRKGWDSYKDLLVRVINGTTADYYVQVIINRNPITEKPVGGWVSGFATVQDVEDAEYFMPEKRNDTKIIDHDNLRSMNELYNKTSSETEGIQTVTA